MTLCVTGRGTTIVRELVRILPANTKITHYRDLKHPEDADRYVFAHGRLTPYQARSQTICDMTDLAQSNWISTIAWCEEILRQNHKARICVIGSESGIKGSFNEVYAGAKAALHHYVETRRLDHPEQQLVAVAPTVVENSGMTRARPDLDVVLAAGAKRRRGRWLHAAEVARVIHFLLYVDEGAVCNSVVRITGGNY